MKSSAPQRSQVSKLRRSRMNPVAIACATLVVASSAAYAQDAANLDTVTVTGIRKAIESSISTKRNADSIVESVNSEDIGKLPDTSIAESLARLPGMAGQRGPDGRTQTVSLRGLGGDFVGATMNGREIVSSGDSRNVEYDQFPSELIGSALVYKSNNADLMGQGIAGTVDVRTVKPLDFKGRQLAVNLRGETNSNPTQVPGVTSGTGKRFSVSFIDQFANNTIGVALGWAHLDSPTQLKQYQMWDFGDITPWGVTTPGAPKAVNGTGEALHPLGMEATAATKKSIRDGVMGVLEFKPNKDFRSQVDLFYSKFDTHQVGDKFMTSAWDMWSGDAKKPAIQNPGITMVGKDTIVTSGTLTNLQTIIQNFESNRVDTTTAIGWNNSYKLNDKWTLIGDLALSRNVRNEKYYENFVAPYSNGAFLLDSYKFNVPVTGFGVAQFVPSLNMANPSLVKMGDPANWVGDSEDAAFAGNIRKPDTKDEMKSFRLSAKRSLDSGMFSGLDVGLNYSQRDKVLSKNEIRLDMVPDGKGGFLRDVPASALRAPLDFAVAGIPQVMAITVSNLVSSGALLEKMALWNKASNDSSISEKVTTAYAKLDIDSEIGKFPVRGNVGVQAVRTEQHSTGWVWLGDNANPNLKDLYKLSGGKTYTDILPSLNLVFDLKNDWMARFALGKSMSRPTVNDMRAGKGSPKVNTNPGPDYATWSAGSSGNPELEPIRATSIDLSIEKYFGKQSYVALAGFHKNLTGMVQNVKYLVDFTGVPNSSGVTPISNYGFATAPANYKNGYVEGVEITAQLEGKLLTPMLDGFGVGASGSSLHTSIANVAGFSGTATNLTFFYEKKGFSARVSQRYRSPFTSVERNVFFEEVKRSSSADKVIDAQVGYAFEGGSLNGLSVLLQVNNLSDRPTNNLKSPYLGSVDKTTMLPNYISYFGRQVLFGVNYKY